MKRNFKVIIFDLDRTLIDIPRKVAYRKLISLLIRKGLLSKSKEKAAFRKLLFIDKRFEKFSRFLEFSKIYFKGSERIARRINYMYQFIDIGKYRVFSDVRRTLGLLSKKYPLYLISYGEKNLQNKKIEITGIRKYFKDVFITEIDNKKPLIEKVFRIERKKNPYILKKEILMVGDSPSSDILAARKAGIVGVLVDYYKSYKKDEIEGDFYIKNISGVLKLL